MSFGAVLGCWILFLDQYSGASKADYLLLGQEILACSLCSEVLLLLENLLPLLVTTDVFAQFASLIRILSPNLEACARFLVIRADILVFNFVTCKFLFLAFMHHHLDVMIVKEIVSIDETGSFLDQESVFL